MDSFDLSQAQLSSEDEWRIKLYDYAHVLHAQLDKVKVEREELRDKVTQYRSQQNASGAQLENLEKQLAETSNQLTTLRRQLRNTEAHSTEQAQTIEGLQQTVQTLQQRKTRRNIKERLEAELQTKQSEYQVLLGERDALLQNIEQWRVYTARVHAEKLQEASLSATEATRLTDLLKERDDLIKSQRNELSALELSKEEWTAHKESMATQLSDCQKLADQLETEKKQLSAELLTSQKALKIAQELSEVQVSENKSLVTSLAESALRSMQQQLQLRTMKATIENMRKPPGVDQGVQVQSHTTEQSIQTVNAASVCESGVQCDLVVEPVMAAAGPQSSAPSDVLHAAPTPPNTPAKSQLRRIKGLPPTRRSQRLAVSTSTEPVHAQASASMRSISTQPDPASSSPASSAIEIVQESASRASASFEVNLNMPSKLSEALSHYPAVEVPPSAFEMDVTFTREQLEAKLGCNLDDTFIRFGDKKPPFARHHKLTGCIFPKLEVNPWLPSRVGEHGYAFMEIVEEKPSLYALFLPIDESGQRWRYYGQYMVEGIFPVPRVHWKNFTQSFKDAYCTMIYHAMQPHKQAAPSPEDMRHLHWRFESDMRIPRVQMICVDYREGLVNDLSPGRRLSTRPSRPTWKRASLPSTPVASPKRPRLA